MTDNLFESIHFPEDLRKLQVNQLRQVCSEMREYLVDAVSQTGGHLGAGLGTVELAVALHYVFDTPDDKLVWDVGHQAYPHKMLTGRKEKMYTMRQFGGISGFLKRSESEYDTFGAGHASTAISAALGIATARDFDGKDFKVVAIVGDGSMTGGMAYEAMNNAGLLKKNLIVVLNDNQMVSLSSMTPKLWSLHEYFNEALTHPTYNKFKANVWDLTGKLDTFGDRLRTVAQSLEKGIKSIITPGMLFEALGFRYFGPFNGHNIVKLVEILQHIKNLPGPILLHLSTEKGKGYEPAEKDVTRLHGVTPFDKVTGKSPSSSGPPSYTSVFGNTMVEICKSNSKVVGITAAMPDGTGLTILQKAMPERFFDVGIAEGHAVTYAAGMASEGYIPVVAVYSTFLQRGFDQIIHDVCLQQLPVVFVMDRGGLVGSDGPTHHGVFDLGYMRMIPHMIIMAPKDEQELRDMLFTCIEYREGPIALRYPRGNAIGVPLRSGFQKLSIGKGEILKEGETVALIGIGNMVMHALKAADLLTHSGINAAVVNMRFVKPLDTELIKRLAQSYRHFVTVEDHVVHGGFGSAVAECLHENRLSDVELHVHGIPDEFIDHGTQEELYRSIDLDPLGIARKVGQVLGIELAMEMEHV